MTQDMQLSLAPPRATRPEASFYKWKELTQEQRRVAVDVHKWLVAICKPNIPPPPSSNNIFVWNRIDASRVSNVIVIDGSRGCGKTSLLLTLVEMWRRSLEQGSLPDDVFADVAVQDEETDLNDVEPPETSQAKELAVRASLKELQKRVIPIRVLDFAPLPGRTSLITWVAAQLREFIDMLDQRTTPLVSDVSEHAVLPWEPDWEKELPSRRAWAELIASAAWGWDDNIEARKGALDPDAYAEELQQSERARVGIVARWRALIRSIVQDAARRYPGQISENARIIVPIDDIDMNPVRISSLLEFIRTFWDPQLVFVLSGDSQLIISALKRQYADVLGTSNDGEAKSHELAKSSYDKVVPFAQRYRLGRLDSAERVRLVRDLLPTRKQADNADRQFVQELPSTIDALLRVDPWAAEALPPTLRESHDLRQTLGSMEHASDVDVARELLANALGYLTDQGERDKVRSHVDLAGGLPWVEGTVLGLDERLGELPVLPGQDGYRSRMVLEDVRSVNVELGSAWDDKVVKVEERCLRGAVVLAADLAADDPDAAWSDISIADLGYNWPAVRARFIFDTPREDQAAGEQADLLLRRGVRWPVPDWKAPVDFALFAAEWRRRVPALSQLLRTETNRDGAVAAAFLDCVWYVHHFRADRDTPEPPQSASSKDAMKRVQADADVVLNDPNPRAQAYVDWVRRRSLLLAAPESGLAVSTAADVLSAVNSPDPEAIAERLKRLELFLGILVMPREAVTDGMSETSPGDVQSAIDELFPDHPWLTTFAPQRPARPRARTHRTATRPSRRGAARK